MTYRKINHAFIMAAGRGTRLMPLTKKIPKGLVKFKQTSLIARGIKRLKKYINCFSFYYNKLMNFNEFKITHF